MSKQKQATAKQHAATDKAYKLRRKSANDDELAKQLGLSKVTLYTRLKKSNWTKAEILFIEYRSNLKLYTLVFSLKIL